MIDLSKCKVNWNKPSIKRELRLGRKIEMEHTKDIGVASTIAKQHICEFPSYYSKGLIPMEKKLQGYKFSLIILSLFLIFISLASVNASVTVTANNTQIGVIRSDFYGVNVNSFKFLVNGTTIDTNNDGVKDAVSNSTWHQIYFNASNIKFIRSDMALAGFYSNITSGGSWTGWNGVNFTGDITVPKALVDFARSSNGKVLWIIDYMPTWLGDNSSGKCSNLGFCPPINSTMYSNIVLDFITRTGCTSDVCEFEVWNEPYSSFWMGALSTDNANKANNYTAFYNTTYNLIKTNNSNWKVGAPAGYRTAQNLMTYFLSNASTLGYSWDFISIHPYANTVYYNVNPSWLYKDITDLQGNCTLIGVTCNDIRATEWADTSSDLQNNSARTAQYGMDNALAYASVLNYLPANVSLFWYHWSEAYNYFSNTNASVYYPNYPFLYSMVSEALLNNQLYVPYNITKSFANNHKAGNTVYGSTSTDFGVKSVVSKDSSRTYVTLINSNLTTQPVTLNLGSNVTGDSLWNYDTNTHIPLVNGVATFGMASNEVDTFYNMSVINPISTPSGNTTNKTIQISYNITEANLQNVTFNWNGTNYTQGYEPDLVGFWNFDNRSAIGDNSTNVYDLSRNGNNGTISGGTNVTLGQGYFNNSYQFNGKNITYIEIPNSNSLNGTTGITAMTLSYWIKPLSFGNPARVISKGDLNAGSPASGWECYTTVATTNNIECDINNQTGTTYKTGIAIPLSTSEWQLLTFVYNGTNIFMYLNGELKPANANGLFTQSVSFSTVPSTTNIRIGIRNNALTQMFNGSIDDLRIYNRSLSSDEVSQLFKNLSITKMDSTNWTQSIYENITNGNLASQSYNYYLCGTNTTGLTTCGSSTTISKIPITSTLSSAFSSLLGLIRDDFYGTNTHGKYLSANQSFVDPNNDGVRDVATNSTWHQQEFLASDMNLIRVDTGFDTVNLTSNNISSFFQHSLDSVNFSYQNNKKVILILQYMPEEIQNRTSGWCSSSGDGYITCSATNYTKMQEYVSWWIDHYTNNGLWKDNVIVEVGNEAQGGSWLNNLSDDDGNKSVEYNKYYNASYDAIKAKYPSISVIGGGGAEFYASSKLRAGFLGNFSGKMDGFSFHQYWNNDTSFANDLNILYSNCTTYSANCSRIYITEWNTNNATIQNSSFAQDGSLIASRFISTLNNASYNSNVSLVFYQWSESFNYFDNVNASLYYPEYPKMWSMVSEPQLNNQIYSPYNVTYSLARYCPSSGKVYQSTSTDGTPIVSCTDSSGNAKSIIFTNNDTEAHNYTLSTSGINTLIDPNSGILYDTSSNSANLGLIDSYGIKVLTKPYFVYDQNSPSGWDINNYLNETIRPATQAEVDQYVSPSDHPVSHLGDNLFARTVLNVMVGIFSLAIVGIGLFFLKYFWDEGELTPIRIVAIALMIILGVVFVQIIAQLVVAQ